MQSKTNILMLIVASALTMGCKNVCEDLDARMCADLGAEDCAVWKEQGKTFAGQAKQRPRKFLRDTLFGPDAQSCESAGSEPTYSQILAATKVSIAATRKAQEAVKAAGLATN